jgi:hypothetical protein
MTGFDVQMDSSVVGQASCKDSVPASGIAAGCRNVRDADAGTAQ